KRCDEREIFLQLLVDDFWNLLSKETNKFADAYLKSPTMSKTDFTNEWFDATADEMRAYFSLSVLMAQVKKNKIQKYWSPKKVTEPPFFGKTMYSPQRNLAVDESLIKFRGRLCYIQYNLNK
ncbi:hypothetical protein J437_LFUL001631, partial [Ladona fulva]